MKRIIVGLIVLPPIAWAGWQIGAVLSSDALGLALGVLFGVMAGIPAALIAIHADRVQRVRVDHVHHIETPETAQALRLPRVAVVYTAIADNARQRPALTASARISDQGGDE